MDALIDACVETLEAVSDEPCAKCGAMGDTLPCLVCDKLLCGECGGDVSCCKEHDPRRKVE